jgi:hypothetical protein
MAIFRSAFVPSAEYGASTFLLPARLARRQVPCNLDIVLPNLLAELVLRLQPIDASGRLDHVSW